VFPLPRRLRRVLLVLLGTGLALAGVVGGLNAYVLLSQDDKIASDVADVPHAQAAIVLGAFVNPDGTMSTMLADRVQQGAALYRAGKVDSVLVSGDHGRWSYDEPDTMRKALEAQGVPSRRIFTDHAGFDTWASMERARTIFGIHTAVVVTQDFHLSRALLLAESAGLKATGLDASLHGYGKQGLISDVREVVARVKGVGEAVLQPAALGGPPHPITGDGRKSWGEQRPMTASTGR